MLCLEGLLFIMGLVILIGGKFNVFGKRKLEGKRARIVGLILMLPIPTSSLIGYVFGSIIHITTRDPELVFRMINEGWAAVMELLIFIGTLVAATLVTWKTPEASVAIPSSPVLTPAEAADYLGMSEEELLQLIERGDLPAQQIGAEYRLDREALIKFAKKRDSISLREMMGSMNPKVRNLIIGPIIGAIIGPTICGGLFAGGPYFAHGLGIGLIFGPIIGAIFGFLIARSGGETMTLTTGRMITLIVVALGVGTIVGVITFSPIIGAIVGLIAAAIFGWLSKS